MLVCFFVCFVCLFLLEIKNKNTNLFRKRYQESAQGSEDSLLGFFVPVASWFRRSWEIYSSAPRPRKANLPALAVSFPLHREDALSGRRGVLRCEVRCGEGERIFTKKPLLA